jgi:PRTRC genetic system protein F
MQSNPIEMRVLEGIANAPQPPALAFQLPTISAAVPFFTEIVSREVDYTTFARALLEANVIMPEMIGANASTPKCILEQGLRAWFKERTDRLHYLKFDVQVFDAVEASEIQFGYEHEPTSYKNWAFCLSGYETSEVRVAEPVALELEKKCPGLFYSAFSAMEAGGWKTADILTPTMIIEQTASYQLWEGDLSEVPADDEAMEYLVDRYGEDAERYLPSVLMKVWGEGFCFARKGQRSIGKRKLKKLCKANDKQVATIARQLLKLLEARAYVDECGAEFNGAGGEPLFTACSIGFNRDDRYTDFIDTHVNGVYESGEYSEFLTINEFPSDRDELDSYFIKLDALFRLMAEVDALIPLLSIGDADK